MRSVASYLARPAIASAPLLPMTEPPPIPTLPAPGAWAQLCLAFGFLTRLPVALAPADAAAPLASAVRGFAFVGAAVGAAGAALYALGWFAGLPPMLAALVALAATVWATGALHEDGLADFADASGASDIERRLAIMRDSRVGTFGVLALVFSLGLRAAALSALGDPALVAAAWVAAAAASRAAMAYPMHALPFARSDGAAVRAGRPARGHMLAALATGAAFLLPLGPFGFALAMSFAAAATFAATAVARRQLGGQTGDALGMAQQGVEISIFVAAVSAAANNGVRAWTG
jgi:adenosylcobinamide-GDP ribazoletransferase